MPNPLHGYDTTLALLPVAALGSILNWTIFYSICNITSYKHAFGYLSANQALADALHSTSFLLYFCPMVLLDSSIMKQFSEYSGAFLLFCYELSVLTHFVISLNRLFAVCLPFHYSKIFSERNTKRVIVALWIFNGFFAILFYKYFCSFYYEESIQFFTFTNSDFCGIIGFYGDFTKNSIIVIVIVCIDILTIIKVRQMKKKVAENITETDHRQFSRREMRFLKQTVFQGAVFMLELLTYFLVPQYFQDRWIVFFATSFAWVSVHAADGVVVMICNPDIRKFLVSSGKVSHFDTSVAISSNQISK